jgi:hypothetical protein
MEPFMELSDPEGGSCVPAAAVATAALVAPHRLFVAAASVCNVVSRLGRLGRCARALRRLRVLMWRIAICAMSRKLVD